MAKISETPQGIESHILRLLIPEEILECFELKQIVENDEEWYSADHIINNQLERPANIEGVPEILIFSMLDYHNFCPSTLNNEITFKIFNHCIRIFNKNTLSLHTNLGEIIFRGQKVPYFFKPNERKTIKYSI